MELTSKQRAQLRGMANGLDTIVQIGKDGIGDNLVQQANEALEARELIKCRVLESAQLHLLVSRPPAAGPPAARLYQQPAHLPGAGQTHPKRRRAGHWDQICTLSREP